MLIEIEGSSNLQYCKPETKSKIRELMNNPTVSFMTKTIIKEGLNKDCLDACLYVDAALEILELVKKDILY